MKRCKTCKGQVDEADIVNIELEVIYICSYCGTQQKESELKGDQTNEIH